MNKRVWCCDNKNFNQILCLINLSFFFANFVNICVWHNKHGKYVEEKTTRQRKFRKYINRKCYVMIWKLPEIFDEKSWEKSLNWVTIDFPFLCSSYIRKKKLFYVYFIARILPEIFFLLTSAEIKITNKSQVG